MSPRRKKGSEGVPLSALFKPVRVRTSRYGTIKLTALSAGDMCFLEELLKRDLQAREFTVEFIQHQLTTPLLSVDEVQSWDNRLLLRVATAWAKQELGPKHKLPERFSFETFKQALDEHLSQELSEITKQLKETALSMANYTNSISSLIGPSLSTISQAGGINSPISSLVESMRKSFLPSTIFQGFADNMRQMAALNIKFIGIEALPLMPRLDSQLKDFLETIHKFTAEPLRQQLAELGRIKLPEPFLSDGLLLSGLNSPIIHTPSYQLPLVMPIHEPEEIPLRAEEALKRRMVESYDIILQLEHSLKQLIEKKLQELHGAPWWKRSVPEAVRQACEERKQRSEKPFESVHHPIQYAYTDDLKMIIIKGDNWKAVFGAIFYDKMEIEVCFNWVIEVRNCVAHTRPISEDQYKRLVVTAKLLQARINRGLGKNLP